MSKIYVLSVYDDTPYREGVEYWTEHDLSELVDYMRSQWDWMGSSELNISVATIGKEGFETIWSDNDIHELVNDNGEFLMPSEQINNMFPILPELEGDLYICRECEVTYLGQKDKCDYCGERCSSGDEKFYNDRRQQRSADREDG